MSYAVQTSFNLSVSIPVVYPKNILILFKCWLLHDCRICHLYWNQMIGECILNFWHLTQMLVVPAVGHICMMTFCINLTIEIIPYLSIRLHHLCVGNQWQLTAPSQKPLVPNHPYKWMNAPQKISLYCYSISTQIWINYSHAVDGHFGHYLFSLKLYEKGKYW